MNMFSQVCIFVPKHRVMRIMKRILCFLILLLAFVSDSSVVKAQQDDRSYKLVFCDEFNQENGSQPDSSKWSRCIRYNAGWNRWISNSKDVVFIKNGQLVCRAIPNKKLVADTAKMLTGAIETRGKYSFRYGKVEVRMKTSNRQGNFPAAWMKPEVIDPQRYAELDIVETFGDLGIAQHAVHNHLTTILKKKGPTFMFRTHVNVKKWHVYGVEWTPDYILYTIDGKTTGYYQKSDDRKMLADGQWTFDRPFFLILNQSVGDGSYESMIPQVNTTYETRFDWIRVYQKQ